VQPAGIDPVSTEHFAFPVASDPVEVMLDGFRGNHYTVTDVQDHKGHLYVTVWAPCNVPGCMDHDPLSTVALTAVRPHVSG
jgi:hypothetical protein